MLLVSLSVATLILSTPLNVMCMCVAEQTPLTHSLLLLLLLLTAPSYLSNILTLSHTSYRSFFGYEFIHSPYSCIFYQLVVLSLITETLEILCGYFYQKSQ